MPNQHLTAPELDAVGRMIDVVEEHRMAIRTITDALRAMPRGKADQTGDDCAGHAALLQLQQAQDALNKAGDYLWIFRESPDGQIGPEES